MNGTSWSGGNVDGRAAALRPPAPGRRQENPPSPRRIKRRSVRPRIVHVITASISALVISISAVMFWTQWTISQDVAHRLIDRNTSLLLDDLENWVEFVVDARRPVAVGDDWSSIPTYGDKTRPRSLVEAISRKSNDIGGTAFVIRPSGDLIAHPNITTSSARRGGEDYPTVPVNHVGDLVLEGLWNSAIHDPDFRTTAAGAVYRLDRYVYGQEYLGFFERINAAGEDWIIGMWLLAEDVHSLSKQLKFGFIVAVVGLVLSVLMAWYLARRMSAPVEQLVVNSRRLSNLELGDVGELSASRVKELGDLSGSFSRMVGSLRSFGTYVPWQLVRHLAANGSQQLDSRECDVAVLFTDVVGFTALSDGMAPIEVAAFLNEHLSILGGIVEKHDGTIDKYIGDSLMAFWGAPDEIDNPAEKACEAALGIAAALERYNAGRQIEGKLPVRIRIGIHCGRALVGNIGAPGRVDYTVVGDTVNAAQRIEALAADIISKADATILISESVAKELPADIDLLEIGTAALKGRKETLVVYRLMT